MLELLVDWTNGCKMPKHVALRVQMSNVCFARMERKTVKNNILSNELLM